MGEGGISRSLVLLASLELIGLDGARPLSSGRRFLVAKAAVPGHFPF